MSDGETRRPFIHVEITRPLPADTPDPADHVPFVDATDKLACACGWTEGADQGWLEHLPPEPVREPTGEWVDIWERPTTAELRDYYARMRKSEDRMDAATEAVRVFTYRWRALDENGEELGPVSRETVDRAGFDLVMQAADAITERLPNR